MVAEGLKNGREAVSASLQSIPGLGMTDHAALIFVSPRKLTTVFYNCGLGCWPAARGGGAPGITPSCVCFKVAPKAAQDCRTPKRFREFLGDSGIRRGFGVRQLNSNLEEQNAANAVEQSEHEKSRLVAAGVRSGW